jgi:ribosomal protein L36
MKIQKVTFPAGGILGRFALHKVTSPYFTGHCSAWFDAKGKLQDCEWIRRDGVHRIIPVGTPMYRYLESLGPIWKGKAK